MKNSKKLSTRIFQWLKDLFNPEIDLNVIPDPANADEFRYRYWPPVFIPDVGCMWIGLPYIYEAVEVREGIRENRTIQEDLTARL